MALIVPPDVEVTDPIETGEEKLQLASLNCKAKIFPVLKLPGQLLIEKLTAIATPGQ